MSGYGWMEKEYGLADQIRIIDQGCSKLKYISLKKRSWKTIKA